MHSLQLDFYAHFKMKAAKSLRVLILNSTSGNVDLIVPNRSDRRLSATQYSPKLPHIETKSLFLRPEVGGDTEMQPTSNKDKM